MSESEQGTVVLRFRDGHTLRCRLAEDFSPRARELDVISDGGTETVSITDLKAVFFVKNERQRSAEMAMSAPREIADSALARVEFFDGEIIRGRVQGYSVANAGFFLYPTALESNNERIFVVATALTTVSIEG